MAREYYYRAPELSGEKLLELFLENQDLCDKDIPVTQSPVDAFFLNCAEAFYEYYDFPEEDDQFLLNGLVRDLEIPNGVVIDMALILSGGETIVVDNNEIKLPYLRLKVKQHEYF